MSQVVSTIATLQVDELFGRPIDGTCFGLISSGILSFVGRRLRLRQLDSSRSARAYVS